MKVSLNWLKLYVDIDVTLDELCNKMISAGFEVEGIENLADTMQNVVVGKILKITPHENSDHLQICQIDVGESEPVQIVTGAQNVFEGAFVPAALHNSILPNGMNIKKGKLRGVESCGMLCSGEELCLKESDYPGAEVYGILILDDSFPAGTDMREVLGLDDVIIDFSVTSNRPDCQCMIGIAREVGVVLNKPVRIPNPTYKTVSGNITDYITVEDHNFDLCERYMGRVVNNLRIKPSPDWIKKCLKAAGMRPINNIVDITNFVMLETGQPMHAFDRRDINGEKIIVRNAYNGEKITTLDEKEHTLTEQMLVIADASAPSCLAGIMGGLNSEIKDDTTELFLESAKFKRDNVRKTARALGVRTESSSRFERGTDIMNVEFAMERALQLISELDAGDIIDTVIDLHQGLKQERPLSVTAKSVNDLLGLNIPSSVMVDILNRLSIKTTEKDGVLNCIIPSWRDDIEGKADIAEEVMRIYGYEHIVGTPLRGTLTRGRKSDERIKADKIKNLLIRNSVREITTYSFISSKALEPLNLDKSDERNNTISIINPLGDEYSTMRTQLTTSMLTVISTNINRKIKAARFFEISKRFIPKSLPLTEQPLELPVLCMGIYGEGEDFFTLKGIIEQLMQSFSVNVKYQKSAEPYLHPGRQAQIVLGDTVIGTLGEVHPKTAECYDINEKVYVAEIKLETLYAAVQPPIIYKATPKFPVVNRDLALLCNKSQPVGDLIDFVKQTAGKLCETVELFDIYEGEQIPDGKKSVAISLVLRSHDATLTDNEVDSVINKVIKRLQTIDVALRQ